MKVTKAMVTLLTGAALQVTAFPSILKRDSACNNHAELCQRQYSNITFVGTHDAYAFGHSVASNQPVGITDQLNDGVRAIQIQGHKGGKGSSGVELCHTSCSLKDGGSLEDALKQIKSFLDKNTQDVVTLIIANNDNLPASNYAKAFEETGLNKLAFKTGKSGKLSKKHWPTLHEMITKNHRLVVFMDYKTSPSSVPYILPEFKNIWENAYDQKHIPFNCTPDRYDGNPSSLMFLDNHFLEKETDILGHDLVQPDKDNIESTNSVDTILSNTNRCAKKHGSYPNFLLVDYYTAAKGGALAAAAKMNGVKYTDHKLSHHDKNSSESSASTLRVSWISIAMALVFFMLM